MGEIERELSGPPGSSDSRRKMLAEALTVIRDQASLLDEAADMLAAAPSSDSPAIPEELQGWKCNNCQTVFTSVQQQRRENDTNGGPRCPCCKAYGQYTYPYALHKGDPCERCGVSHDDVAPGPCQGSKPTPASHTAPDALRTALIACGRHAGAILSDDVSDEFLSFIPEEVRLKLAALTTPAPADTNAALIEALTPSGSTKAAYHGEFFFETEDGVSNAGIERFRKVYVPWDTVKQIMEAIRARAALNQGRQAS
jgi:hypothetical protein